MAEFNGAPQPRKKIFTGDYREPHPVGSIAEGARNPTQFMWGIKNNGKIIFVVNDGVYIQGQKTTHKELELDGYTRGILFETLLEAANNKDFTSKQFQIKKRDFVGGGQLSENPINKGLFTIRRDDRGVVHWGYTSSSGDYKKEVSFERPFGSIIFTNQDGNKVEDHAFLSMMYVRSYVKKTRPYLDAIEISGWAPPKPKNGGNNNNNQNNNGGGNNDMVDFDDFEM